MNKEIFYDHYSMYVRGIWGLLQTFQDSLWISTDLESRVHYRKMIDMTCDEIMLNAMNA